MSLILLLLLLVLLMRFSSRRPLGLLLLSFLLLNDGMSLVLCAILNFVLSRLLNCQTGSLLGRSLSFLLVFLLLQSQLQSFLLLRLLVLSFLLMCSCAVSFALYVRPGFPKCSPSGYCSEHYSAPS